MTKLFRYDWSRFDAKIGLIFMVGTLVVFNLMGRFDFAMYAAGVSALLAWITIILVPRRRWRQHLLGLVVYLVIGVAFTWLADILAPYDWGRLVAMAIVTFAGYLMLLGGSHPFMVAWCLVYWYLVTAICSFLALGAIYVNAGLLIGIFFFLISYPWGGMHSDLGHLIANEKLIGELVGVVVAVVAITILARLQRGTESPRG